MTSSSSDPSRSDTKINVLFCCLGNICRSPMALAVFQDVAVKAGVRDRFGILDSAGTAHYHTGEEPDERTIALLQRYNIPYDPNNLARGVTPADFSSFDYIFGMDTNNVRNLQRMQPPNSKASVRLFGSCDDGHPIADSYYTGDFEATYNQVLRYSHAFLRQLGLNNGKAKS